MSRQLTPLALAVLHLLTERPMHPYELQQVIREREIDRFVKVTHGSLYHTVERLAANGLIEPVETSREGRRPERTVYAATSDGRDQATLRLEDLIARPVWEYPLFGAAMTFVNALPADRARDLLETRAVCLEGFISAHNAIIDGYRKRGLRREQLIEAEYAIVVARAELDWIRTVAEDVQAGRLDWPEPGEGSPAPQRLETEGRT